MSDGYAIAAVSAALRQTVASSLARDQVSDIVGNITVSTVPPDRVIPPNGADPTQLNLFLHQVTPNVGWRNVDLPSRGGDGQRTAAPPLALNLHYLLTAYGDRPHVAEILLGHAMRVLHENATLSRDSVRTALTPTAVDPLLSALQDSGLADQVELIKITPEAVNTEDMSRLWSALQAQYRPTTAYMVTVVLIDGRASAAPPLPVGARGLQSTALSRPTIETVTAKSGPNDPLLATTVLEIKGDGLSGPGVEIAIGAATAVPASTDVSSGRIELALAAVGGALRAGVQGVQVRFKVDLGEPPAAHDGEVSNVVPVTLRPTLSNPVVAVSAAAGSRKTGTVTVELAPRVGRLQRVGLVLNRSGPVPDGEPRSYAFPGLAKDAMANPDDPDTDTLALPFALVEAADYLLRVEVDGAQSLLSTGADGRFNAPLVTVP